MINRTSPRSSVNLEVGESQEFTARASDPDGNLAAVEWRLDGDRECRESFTPRREYSSSCSLRFSSDGSYRLEVTFMDSDRATDSETWNITVERVGGPPGINRTSPRSSVNLEVGESQEFTARASDPDGNLDTVEWRLDGSRECSGESISSGSEDTSDCALRFSSEGDYRLEVTFRDDAGASDSYTWNITVERGGGPPEINRMSPRSSVSLEVGESQEFTARASDPDGDLAAVEWRLDGRERCGGESIRSGSAHVSSCTLSFPSEGRYRLEVTFTDSAREDDSETWSVTVELPPNVPPVINSASPSHSQSLSLVVGQSQEFTARASDADGNLARVEWTLDGNRECRDESISSGSSDSSSCELRFPSEDTYRLEVTFTDSLGEPASATWVVGVVPPTPTPTPPPTPTYTPTPSPPVIYDTSPDHSRSLSLAVGQSREFTAKASDDDGNLASVEWTLNGRERCGEESTLSGSAHASSCSVNFSSEGKFRLQVTFTDSRGVPASQTWEIDVVPPTPTPTPTPTDTPTSGITPVPEPTNTPETPPTNTPVPEPTNTPETPPTNTPVPEPTNTPGTPPTVTPVLEPTDTPEPPPTNTPVPEPTNTPETLTKIPVAESTDTPTGRTPPPEQSGGCGSVADSLPFGTSAANLALLLAPLGLLGIRKLTIRRR